MLKIKTYLLSLLAFCLGLIGQAHAAVPAAAQTAMDDMKTDALAVATAFLVVAIAVAAYMWMRKPAK